MLRSALLTSALLFCGTAASADEAALRDAAQEVFAAIPALPAPSNEAEAVQIELGSMLFFDPRMSSSGLFSCQSAITWAWAEWMA